MNEKIADTGGKLAAEALKQGASVSEMAFIIVVVITCLCIFLLVTGILNWMGNRELRQSQADSNKANAETLPIMGQSLLRLAGSEESISKTLDHTLSTLEKLCNTQDLHQKCVIEGLEMAKRHVKDQELIKDIDKISMKLERNR